MQKISYLSLSILLGIFVLATACNKKEPANKPPEFITDPAELLEPVVLTRKEHLRELKSYLELEYSGKVFDKTQRELWEEKTGREASLFAVHGEISPTVIRGYTINEKKTEDGKDVIQVHYEVLGQMEFSTRFRPNPRLHISEIPVFREGDASIYTGGIFVSREYIEKDLLKNVDDEGELDYESKISLQDIKKTSFVFDKIVKNPEQRQTILDQAFGKKINVRDLYKINDVIENARSDKTFDIQTQDIALYEFLEKYTHSSNLEKLKLAFKKRNGETLTEVDKKNIEIIDYLLSWVRSREMAG